MGAALWNSGSVIVRSGTFSISNGGLMSTHYGTFNHSAGAYCGQFVPDGQVLLFHSVGEFKRSLLPV